MLADVYVFERLAQGRYPAVRQCLKWSKKEAAGLSRNPRSSAPSPEFSKFIFDLKMASFGALLAVFYAI